MTNIIRKLLQGEFAEANFKSSVKISYQSYKPNEKIMQAEITYPDFFVVSKGKVRVVLKNENSEHKYGSIVAELSEGELFGEFSLFDDQPSSAEVNAIVETQVIKIDKKSFLTFLEANPQVGYKVLHEMTHYLIRRLRDENKIISRFMGSTIDMHKSNAKRA